MKTIHPDAITALASGNVIVSGAAAFYTTPDPAFVWGGFGPLQIGDDVYTGIGDHGTVAPISFELGGVEGGLQLRLSNIPSIVLSMIQEHDVRGKTVVVHRLTFNAAGTILLDASRFFVGRCDTVPMNDTIGGSAEAVFNIEGSARGLNRSGARMANLEDQLLIDPNDNSFKTIATVGSKTLTWMGKPPERAGGVVNGGTIWKPGTPLQVPNAPHIPGWRDV